MQSSIAINFLSILNQFNPSHNLQYQFSSLLLNRSNTSNTPQSNPAALHNNPACHPAKQP
jgi:hypothetical protein